MKERYSIDTTGCGYIIRDAQHILPLPFNFISRQYAAEACREFNEKVRRLSGVFTTVTK